LFWLQRRVVGGIVRGPSCSPFPAQFAMMASQFCTLAPDFVPAAVALCLPPALPTCVSQNQRVVHDKKRPIKVLQRPQSSRAEVSAIMRRGLVAAGLFCPLCIDGGPCAFHKPTATPTEEIFLQTGFPRELPRTAGYQQDIWHTHEVHEARVLPPMPKGRPPSPPGFPPADLQAFPCQLVCKPFLALPGDAPNHTLPLLKSFKDSDDDASTELGGSESQYCLESDASDAAPSTHTAMRCRQAGPNKIAPRDKLEAPLLATSPPAPGTWHVTAARGPVRRWPRS